MKTTVHVQPDPATHYQVVLKHKSGQPKVLHSLTIKNGRAHNKEPLFFGRMNGFAHGNGVRIELDRADHEDLRVAIDFLTELRDTLVLGGLPYVARVRYTSKDGKTEWKRMQDMTPVEMAKMVLEIDDWEKKIAARKKGDAERVQKAEAAFVDAAIQDSQDRTMGGKGRTMEQIKDDITKNSVLRDLEEGLADLKAGRVLGPFKSGKELRAAMRRAKPGDTIEMGPSYDATGTDSGEMDRVLTRASKEKRALTDKEVAAILPQEPPRKRKFGKRTKRKARKPAKR